MLDEPNGLPVGRVHRSRQRETECLDLMCPAINLDCELGVFAWCEGIRTLHANVVSPVAGPIALLFKQVLVYFCVDLWLYLVAIRRKIVEDVDVVEVDLP